MRRLVRFAVALLLAVALLTVATFILDAIAVALAQSNPFGGPRPSAPPPSAPSGFAGWMLAKQAEFYRGLSAALRSAKSDGAALYGLYGLSFLYGAFHAAGPGHGKAVISSYLLANEETWRRGIALSFASAMLQALVAVAVVGVAAVLLGATAKAMGEAVRWIEMASYALIAAIGARLVWVKGRALSRVVARSWTPQADPVAHQHGHPHHGHHHQGHHHHGDHDHGHRHQHAAGEGCEACGHSHGPEPAALAGAGGLRRGLWAILAVGLRPCSGAILVLVFALAQGLFWAGVVSTFLMGLGTAITVAAIATLAVTAKGLAVRFAGARAGGGEVVLRGIETLGALLVLGFGVALLAGYMASERLAMT